MGENRLFTLKSVIASWKWCVLDVYVGGCVGWSPEIRSPAGKCVIIRMVWSHGTRATTRILITYRLSRSLPGIISRRGAPSLSLLAGSMLCGTGVGSGCMDYMTMDVWLWMCMSRKHPAECSLLILHNNLCSNLRIHLFLSEIANIIHFVNLVIELNSNYVLYNWPFECNIFITNANMPVTFIL